MGQVLRLPRPRRYRVKWSAVQLSGSIVITAEWRTADRAQCAVQCISRWELENLTHPAEHFWQVIEYLRHMAVRHGARF